MPLAPQSLFLTQPDGSAMSLRAAPANGDPLVGIPFRIRLENKNGVLNGLYKGTDSSSGLATAQDDAVNHLEDLDWGTGLIATKGVQGANAFTLDIVGGVQTLKKAASTAGGLITNVDSASIAGSYSAVYTVKVLADGGCTIFAASGGSPFKFFHLAYPTKDVFNRYDKISFTGANGVWATIAYVYDAVAKTETFWQSGIQVAQRTGVNSMDADSGNIAIGSSKDTGFPLVGNLGALFVSDIAYTPTQVQVVSLAATL